MNHTNVFLIRHGETDFNRDHLIQGRGIDKPLNETGRAQAKAIAKLLKPYPVEKVVASSLIRTQQTARLITNGTSEFEYCKDIDEMDFGEIEGQPFNEIRDKIITIHETWMKGNVDFKCPGGGESPKEVFNRADNKIRQVLSGFKGHSIAFVVHGRLIRILLSQWLGYGLPNMHKIKHTNGSVNHLMWDGTTFEPIALNQTHHLEEIFES